MPYRLDTQDLVEMLKFPTCVGEVRRVLLTQLGNRYHRRFTTHWDFVRYAADHGLNLDFTTVPGSIRNFFPNSREPFTRRPRLTFTPAKRFIASMRVKL